MNSSEHQRIRQARTARIRTIRRRIVSGGVALFMAAWLLIAVVLVTGHDPALAKKAQTASSGTTTGVGATGTSSTSGATTTSTTTTTSVTTGQS